MRRLAMHTQCKDTQAYLAVQTEGKENEVFGYVDLVKENKTFDYAGLGYRKRGEWLCRPSVKTLRHIWLYRLRVKKMKYLAIQIQGKQKKTFGFAGQGYRK